MKKLYINLLPLIFIYSSIAQAEDNISNMPYYLELGAGTSVNSAKESSGDSSLNAGITSYKTGGALSASLGYIYTPQIRFDVNITYLPQWNLSESYNISGVNQTGSYNSDINSLATTLNAHYDIANISAKQITPYIMGGAGVANNQVGNMDIYRGQNKIGTLNGDSSYSFAWNLGAGINYPLNERLSLGIGYKFSNLGKVKTKSGYQNSIAIINGVPVPVQQSTIEQIAFKNLYAQQIMLNIRVKF